MSISSSQYICTLNIYILLKTSVDANFIKFVIRDLYKVV